jgi:hypothetical protein
MRYIYDYFQYINEKKVYEDLCNIIIDNFNNNILEFTIDDYSQETYVLHKRFIKIKNLKVKFNIIDSNIQKCDGLCNANNSSFSNDYLIDTILTFNIHTNKEIDDNFKKYISTVINHEVLHLYQIYNLYKNDKFRPEYWIIGGSLPIIRTKVKTEYTKYIIHILYQSLSHEIYSQLRQYYIYQLDDKNYLKINQIIDDLKNFNVKEDLSDEEILDINLFRNLILRNLKHEIKNKKYLNNIEKSLWNEEDVNLFLSKLKDKFHKQSLLLHKKKKKIDKSFKMNENYYSLPTNFEEMEINHFYRLDDIIFDVLYL